MKVTILYRQNSDYNRALEEYAHDFEQRTGKKLDMLDVDTRDGIAEAELYDVVQYPGIIAVSNSGQIMKVWQGMPLPLINELSFYTQEN